MVLTLCYNYLLPHSLWVHWKEFSLNSKCWINSSNFSKAPSHFTHFIYTSEYSLFSTLNCTFCFWVPVISSTCLYASAKSAPYLTSLNHDLPLLSSPSTFSYYQILIKIHVHAQTGRHRLTHTALKMVHYPFNFSLEWFEEKASISIRALWK